MSVCVFDYDHLFCIYSCYLLVCILICLPLNSMFILQLLFDCVYVFFTYKYIYKGICTKIRCILLVADYIGHVIVFWKGCYRYKYMWYKCQWNNCPSKSQCVFNIIGQRTVVNTEPQFTPNINILKYVCICLK